VGSPKFYQKAMEIYSRSPRTQLPPSTEEMVTLAPTRIRSPRRDAETEDIMFVGRGESVFVHSISGTLGVEERDGQLWYVVETEQGHGLIPMRDVCPWRNFNAVIEREKSVSRRLLLEKVHKSISLLESVHGDLIDDAIPEVVKEVKAKIESRLMKVLNSINALDVHSDATYKSGQEPNLLHSSEDPNMHYSSEEPNVPDICGEPSVSSKWERKAERINDSEEEWHQILANEDNTNNDRSASRSEEGATCVHFPTEPTVAALACESRQATSKMLFTAGNETNENVDNKENMVIIGSHTGLMVKTTSNENENISNEVEEDEGIEGDSQSRFIMLTTIDENENVNSNEVEEHDDHKPGSQIGIMLTTTNRSASRERSSEHEHAVKISQTELATSNENENQNEVEEDAFKSGSLAICLDDFNLNDGDYGSEYLGIGSGDTVEILGEPDEQEWILARHVSSKKEGWIPYQYLAPFVRVA